MRLLLAAFFLEAGFALVLVPWSSYWEHNYFAAGIPILQTAITNNFVRGAVSGLGLVNVAAGVVELVSLLARQREPESIVTIGRSSAE